MTDDRKNPFPRKSVVSLDSGGDVPFYTLVTPQVERASHLAIEYLEDGIGQVITIQGPYGSGKSHLINFSRHAVEQAHSTSSIDVRLVQLYHRASSADFVSFYRELIKQIGFELLQEVSDRFLAVVAAKEMATEMEKSKGLLDLLPENQKAEVEARYEQAIKERVEHLRSDPKNVYQYLDNLIIQPETVYDQRATELQIIAGENFKKAFFYLPDLKLGRTAYSWFVIDEMSNEDIARLGVSGRLNSTLDAKYALSLLVTLFRHSGIRLLIYFDQVEKLLVGTDSKTLDENRGVLQSLAEICPRENTFLALVGANDGWDLVREDFWSRVGATRFQLGNISTQWARALIKVYLREKEAYNVKGGTDEEDVKPFTFDGSDEIQRISNGNVRLFLQVCYEVFKQHLSGQVTSIGQEEVKKVVSTQADEGSVSAEIQNILRQKGLPFQLQPKLTDSFTPDLAIGERNNPLAVVEISNSLFYVDEADDALALINRREELTKQYPQTHFIVVNVGYASNEVTEQLKQAVDSYLVYEGQSFAKSFETILDSLSTNGIVSHIETHVSPPELKEDLKQLLAAREQEMSELKVRLEQFAETQKPKLSPRYQDWRAWLRADQVKWEKRQEELASAADSERTSLQESGEAARFRRLVVRSIWYFIGMFIVLYLFLNSWWSSALEITISGRLSLAITLGLFLVLSLVYFRFIYFPLSPLLLRTREIGRYSGELGQLVLRAKTSRLSPERAKLCLNNPNPIIRYFGALVFLTRTEEKRIEASPSTADDPVIAKVELPPLVEWNELAVTENWKPLFLTYLRLAFRTQDQHKIQEMLDLMVEAKIADPRILYLLALLPMQFRQQMDMNFSGLNATLRSADRTLAHGLFTNALSHYGDWRRSVVQYQPLATFVRWLQGLGNAYDKEMRFATLTRWFEERGQFWYPELETPVQLEIDENDLESIIDALTPHREVGLASFSDLPGNNAYMKLYRFFAEIKWRFQQGDVLLKQ